MNWRRQDILLESRIKSWTYKTMWLQLRFFFLASYGYNHKTGRNMKSERGKIELKKTQSLIIFLFLLILNTIVFSLQLAVKRKNYCIVFCCLVLSESVNSPRPDVQFTGHWTAAECSALNSVTVVHTHDISVCVQVSVQWPFLLTVFVCLSH